MSIEYVKIVKNFNVLDADENMPAEYEPLLQNENHEQWEMQVNQVLAHETLNSSFLKSNANTYRAKLRAYLGSWSDLEARCSPNFFLKSDLITAHRVPKANCTDAIVGKLGLTPFH